MKSKLLRRYVHCEWTYCLKIGILSGMITALDIRDRLRMDVVDYRQLVSCLREYAKPRDRITGLLAEGSLIRVRFKTAETSSRFCC